MATVLEAALRFLDSLDDTQRAAASYPFDTDERFRWTYLPGSRGGLVLADMNQQQRGRALALVGAALSAEGAATARQIMQLELVLRDLEEAAAPGSSGRRDPQYYWFAIFGDPADRGPWAWRVGGHHLCLHFTAVGGAVAVTPLFFGANPARVASGAHAGMRTLAAEEDLGRELVTSLDDSQRRIAIVSAEAPADILTRDAARIEIAAVPSGISYDELDADQQAAMSRLLAVYTGRVRGAASVAAHELRFAWLGSTRPGAGHYYALRSDDVLIEYDNTQNGANHIHTVWRDRRRDWGDDLLRDHYRQSHAG